MHYLLPVWPDGGTAEEGGAACRYIWAKGSQAIYLHSVESFKISADFPILCEFILCLFVSEEMMKLIVKFRIRKEYSGFCRNIYIYFFLLSYLIFFLHSFIFRNISELVKEELGSVFCSTRDNSCVLFSLLHNS